MAERPKGTESAPPSASEKREVTDSDRPTIPAPKLEKQEEKEGLVYRAEAITLGKFFGKDENEDSFFQSKEGLFVVADGVGGEKGADIASQTTVEIVGKYVPELKAIRQKRLEGDTSATIERETALLRKALREANARVALKREEMPVYPKMGSTCVAVWLTRDEGGRDFVIVAHVGDSRAYLEYPDGKLETLTLDDHLSLRVVKHTHGEEVAMRVQGILDQCLNREHLESLMQLVKDGKEFSDGELISKEDVQFLIDYLPPDWFEYYFKNPSQLIGVVGHASEVHVRTIPAPPGSKILIASDGIDGLTHRELAHIVAGDYDALEDKDVRGAAQTFADNVAQAVAFAAKERQEQYGSHLRSRGVDDTTVVMIEVPKR